VKVIIRLIIVLMIITIALPSASLNAQPIIGGAGATFPSPLYFKWIEEYGKAVPSRITYRETGSSDGITPEILSASNIKQCLMKPFGYSQVALLVRQTLDGKSDSAMVA